MIRNIALIFALVAAIAAPSEVFAGHLGGRNGNLPNKLQNQLPMASLCHGSKYQVGDQCISRFKCPPWGPSGEHGPHYLNCLEADQN